MLTQTHTQYRPAALDDLVAHEDIISILKKLIASDQLPHLLLYGPPGTGKTSTIVAMAKAMFGETKYKRMVLELNASDERGIDVVRNQIKDFAGTGQLFSSGTKLIVLDECDAMTNDAQYALRRIIEKNTKNCRFCLICNYVSKIIPALQSRCTRFRFAPLKKEEIRDRLQEVAVAEQVNITKGGSEAILDLADGDMRRVMNLLQAASMAYDVVDEKNVYLTSGQPEPGDMQQIAGSLMNDSMVDCAKLVRDKCVGMGYALADVITCLVEICLSLELPDEVLGWILEGMATIEHNLAFGCDENLQTAALVGVFVKGRGMMTPA
jgi:replication factor C subunit 3/5